MSISKMVKDEKEISYETLRQIQEHAKRYESVADKKEFLKNVGAYEQKLILLNSDNPYEVLCYLEELDLPTTKLILSELNYDEISKILGLFTTEDKKRFYTTFSELSLVNQFIAYDKSASEYIEDLSIDRKINLLNSSDSETVLASSKVYDSIPDEDKQRVVSSISSADAVSALSNSAAYNESNVQDTNITDNSELEVASQTKIQQNIDNQDKENEFEQEDEDSKENDQILEKDPMLQQKMDYFKNNIEKYKATNPELNDLDINDPQFYSLLSDTILDIINKDFYQSQNKNQNQLAPNTVLTDVKDSNLDNSDVLDRFTQAKQQCENELIVGLKNQIGNNITLDSNFEQELLDEPKTL